MKKIKKLTLAITVGFALYSCSNNHAEQKNTSDKTVETISVPDSSLPVQVKNLMKFLGHWESDATLTLEGKPYKVIYKFYGKQTANGSGLNMDEGFSHPEVGTMIGANLAGLNPYDSKIHWFSVDNMGTTHEHIGSWLTPDHLYLEHNSIQEGKPFQEKLDLTFHDKDTWDINCFSTLDGKETARLIGIFHHKI